MWQYIQENSDVDIIDDQNFLFEVVFRPFVGKEVLSCWRVHEALVDPAFKTNRQKLELLAVMVSCMGVGISLEYFLIEAGTGKILR